MVKWVTVKSAIYMDQLRNFSLSIVLIIYGVFIESSAASYHALPPWFGGSKGGCGVSFVLIARVHSQA